MKTSIVVLFLLLIIPIFSVEVKKIETNSYTEFQAGEFQGAALDNTGRVYLGPQIKKIVGPEQEYFLSLVCAKNGDLYLGSGHNGLIYKIPANTQDTSKIEEIHKFESLDVYALLVTEKNEIIAASSPNGKIYKITSGKNIVEMFNPDEKIIWDIQEDNEGSLICALGNPGAVYKIDKTGNSNKLLTPDDSHIVRIFISKDNSIYAGSGENGILYKIENRKTRVVFDSAFSEIRGICEDKEGNIYFSATQSALQKDSDKTDDDVFVSEKKRKTKQPLPDEKSAVYLLNTNGVTEKIFTLANEYIYTLCYQPNENAVLIGTGNEGRIYQLRKNRQFSIIYESESAQIFKIVSARDGFMFLSNNNSGIAKIEDKINNSGMYLSEVYDLDIQSLIGKVYWRTEGGQNSSVALAIRAGNTNIPNETWTKWSAPLEMQGNENPLSGYRYVQVKANLNASNVGVSPYFSQFNIYYLQANIEPFVKFIQIIKPVASPVTDIEKEGTKKNQQQKNEKSLLIKWETDDPNHDALNYSLFLQKYPEQSWIPVKDDIREDKYQLDTELYEDGVYVIKVVADDSLNNSPETQKSTSKISASFIIDSTAPDMQAFAVANNLIQFTANDLTSNISNVLVSRDGEKWYPVLPLDRICDSKNESFQLSAKEYSSAKMLFIKIVDECNNYKVFQKQLKSPVQK